MTDQSSPNTVHHLEPARKAWVEAMALLLRHKNLILLTSIAVTIVTVVYMFFIAKIWFKAEANIVPARKQGGMFDNITAGISSTIKDLGLTQLAGKNKSDGVYSPLAIVGSRTVGEQMVKDYGLMKVYETENIDDAIKEFGEHTSVAVLEEGNIGVSFEDTDPKRAAQVANRLVGMLNEVNSKLANDEAKFNRSYIETRYGKMIADLDSSEKALGAYQRKYGVYELKTQAAAQLSVLSTLEQQRYLSEIQLANAEQLYGTESPEANTMRTQMAELRKKLEDLRTGMDQNAKSYFPAMNAMPDVALDYLRLTREVEIQSKLKAFMLPSYEQAKMDENKQSLSFIMLDSAQVPFRKTRPKRSIAILVAFFGSIVLTSLAVIAATRVGEARERFRRDRKILGV